MLNRSGKVSQISTEFDGPFSHMCICKLALAQANADLASAQDKLAVIKRKVAVSLAEQSVNTQLGVYRRQNGIYKRESHKCLIYSDLCANIPNEDYFASSYKCE